MGLKFIPEVLQKGHKYSANRSTVSGQALPLNSCGYFSGITTASLSTSFTSSSPTTCKVSKGTIQYMLEILISAVCLHQWKYLHNNNKIQDKWKGGRKEGRKKKKVREREEYCKWEQQWRRKYDKPFNPSAHIPPASVRSVLNRAPTCRV